MKTVSGLGHFQLFLFLLLLFIVPCISAQEAPDSEGQPVEIVDGESVDTPEGEVAEGAVSAEGDAAEAEPEVVLPPGYKNLEMEIRTSTLTELAAWCRLLGLSEGGDVNVLMDRLRTHFELPAPVAEEGADKRKIITIDSARSTEYFKIEEVDEEYARLTGDVRVTLKDGESIHEIRAWEILFNRTRNILAASGGVEYIKNESGKPTEVFRGDSITVNIDNWASVFLGGVSERSFQGGENDTAYMFSGTVISRNDEDTTILSKATISSAQNKEALWSLSASRIWLLPGSDFAVFNALLKVGEIPVFYLPFFYYPADEVIFHPVMGYRTREGNYIQTTTYLLGRPPPTTEKTSLAKMLGNSSDMEKKREGMFLRSTGKTPQSQNETRLKLMADYYANLGGYAGVDLAMPKLGIMESLTLNASVARTRTLFDNGAGGYTPFNSDYEENMDWNDTNLFSIQVPFRYYFKMSSSIRGKYGSFSWNIPYYSDPFIDRDFSTRKEEMDWVNMLEQGATALEGDTGTETLMGAPMWQVTGNVNLPRFSSLAPFINTISISGISSTITFGSREMKVSSTDLPSESPTRFFFYPNNATLYSVNGSISGAPLTLGAGAPAAGNSAEKKEEVPNPFEGFGAARSPWATNEEEAASSSDPADALTPPVLKQTFTLPNAGDFQFRLDYSLSPSASSALKFNSGEKNWPEYQDISWSDAESVISTFGMPARVTLNFSHTSGFYTGSFTFSGTGEWHQFDLLNEEAEAYLDNNGETDPVKIRNARESQYRQSRFSTSYALSNTLRPLYKNSVFSQSNLQYQLSGLAVRSNFLGMNDEEPEWELEYGEWDKDKITAHSLNASLNASIMNKNQILTMSATMPPKDSIVSSSATFNVWILTTTGSMSVRFPLDEEKRTFDPFNATGTLTFGTYGSFVQRLTLDTETREFTSLTSALNLSKWGFNANFSAIRTAGYELDKSRGWVALVDDPTLKPRDLSLSYRKTFSTDTLWYSRIKYSLQMEPNLSFDLLRYTGSQFNYTMRYAMTITNFLEVGLSVRSENAVIYRYYRSLLPDLPDDILNAEGEQYNVFTDLLNSFRFDDENKRRSSGFVMKSFSVDTTHQMGDWNAKLTVGLVPYVPTGEMQYQLNTEISFFLEWIPIALIKTKMEYNKRDDRWIIE